MKLVTTSHANEATQVRGKLHFISHRELKASVPAPLVVEELRAPEPARGRAVVARGGGEARGGPERGGEEPVRGATLLGLVGALAGDPRA